MNSKCPFCNCTVDGTPINKREASLWRSIYKMYTSLLLPIPLIGSYLGGKIYDLCSSPDEWYHRFICPDCKCSWIATNSSKIKSGGNKQLTTFFAGESFVIGAIQDNICLINSSDSKTTSSTVMFPDEKGVMIVKYLNGKSSESEHSFGKLNTSNGLYVGEYNNGLPNGFGIIFHKNGFMWFGKWLCGEKNGIGYECNFDGSDYRVGYWLNNKYII